VLEVGKASSRSLDLLHTEVRAFSGPIARACSVVVQDLLPPPQESMGEATDLGYLVRAARDDRLVSRTRFPESQVSDLNVGLLAAIEPVARTP